MSYIINKLKVTIAVVFHLLPFRTEKLSPPAPMVLHSRESRSSPIFMPLPLTGKRLFILLQIYMDQALCLLLLRYQAVFRLYNMLILFEFSLYHPAIKLIFI